MASETRQAGLTGDERSDIRSTVLDTREQIEDDLYRQLKRYGVYEDKRVDLEQLGHLDSYDIETRRKINAAIDREMEATEGDYQRSLKNYVREATKTYMNRLVALKAIEVRGLVTETLMERPEYGNRSEMLRTVDEVAGELTDQQDGGQSAALELAYTELTDEIGVIFEESEHTAIDLDFAVRGDVIEQLNEIDESVWESDEAMGWVYQYFGEKEREEIDDRIDEENYKVQDTDVATKTQLFTPRYIVEWMVDNSLGRLWLEMHGEDTDIDDEDTCFHLAPLEESLIDRDAKNVRDIKILDPACGSGHMLFYAFDILYEMYLEQGDVAEKYIPREILKHNLYGIDIDPGAAQLAALSLYVKAKSEESDVEIDQINVVSADAVLVNGEKKEEVLAGAETELEKRVLEQVWQSFEHVREWGSLVRIEERIEEIIEEELEEIRATGQTQFTEDGLAKQSSVVSFSGEEESWEQVKDRLLYQVSNLAEEALEHDDPIEEMFAGEVEKSVQLSDAFVEEYDIVISNPPYLSSGKIGEELKSFLKSSYKGHLDLYTAFIQRSLELLKTDGYSSVVVKENFMFLKSFEDLRKYLLTNSSIIEGCHLLGYSFPGGDRPFTVSLVMQNSNPDNSGKSKFYRLSDDKDEYSTLDKKRSGLNKITNAVRNMNAHEDIYEVNQETFTEIGRSPFIYWLGDEVLSQFSQHKSLGELSVSGRGLQTGDNDAFVRKYWEVSEEINEEKYRIFQKSGSDEPYYDFPTDMVLWGPNGKYLKEKGNPTDSYSEYYSEELITFRRFGKVFTARLLDDSAIFDINSPFIKADSMSNFQLLGILNSSFVRFIMDSINPGVNFQPGDVKQIPIKDTYKNENRIENIVQNAVSQRKKLSKLTETSHDFSPQYFEEQFEKVTDLLYMEGLLSADVEHAHGELDRIIFDEYGLSDDAINHIYNNLPTKPASYEHHKYNVSTPEEELCYYNPATESESDRLQEISDFVEDNIEVENVEISHKLGVSPFSVAECRYRDNIYSNDRLQHMCGRILSYYIGLIFGRWEVHNEIDGISDGILMFDRLSDNDITDRLREAFNTKFEDVYEFESEIEEHLNKEITTWLRENFFRYHHCKEYRRRGQRIPIYWHLESDDGAFSCFVYYHAMGADTFPTLRGQYIDQRLDTLQNRLEAVESELDTTDGDRARDLRSEKEEIEADIDDITDFRDRVDALIEEGFEPDFEAGIWENIQKVDEHDLLAVPLDKL